MYLEGSIIWIQYLTCSFIPSVDECVPWMWNTGMVFVDTSVSLQIHGCCVHAYEIYHSMFTYVFFFLTWWYLVLQLKDSNYLSCVLWELYTSFSLQTVTMKFFKHVLPKYNIIQALPDYTHSLQNYLYISVLCVTSGDVWMQHKGIKLWHVFVCNNYDHSVE